MKQKKWISIILAVMLFLNMFLEMTSAVFGNEYMKLSDEVKVSETFVLPDVVEQAEAIKKGFIGREKELEPNRYTFVFNNEDGTNTMKLYSYPVKYVDNNGKMQDITTDIKQMKDGNYKTANSDIVTTFSKKLSDGISMEHENVDITLIPVMKNQRSTTELMSELSEDSKTVTYQFGMETTLEYSLTYTGFKEDIVVNEYTGQTEYEFRLYTNGLFLIQDETGVYLENEMGEIEANIGDVIIFTADERNNTFGSMTY